MTSDQKELVRQAYSHLIGREDRGWDSLDDYIDYLEYLDDDQLSREAGVIYLSHAGAVGCGENHPREECFIPVLVEASAAILDLYAESGSMHEKNKYILQYYLAMNQAGMIVAQDV